MLLADMGAEILTLRAPARVVRDPMLLEHDPLLRGRAVLECDLKHDGIVDCVLEVLDAADILLEGYRPGVMERLGLGPDTCLARRPTLVYGRVTGWGQNGPLANAPGHDPNYLAITGALATIGYPDRPPVLPLNLVADLSGGALYLLTGVLAALAHVRAGGEGQVVDAAMIDGVASLMSWVYGARSEGVWEGSRGANLMDGGCPFSSVYETADGRCVAVAAVEPQFYAALLDGLGLEQATLPPREDRARWPELRTAIAAAFRTHTRREWSDLLEGTPACVSPVLELDEVAEHPQIAARQALSGATHPSVAAPRFSRTPSAVAAGNPGSPAALLDGWGVAPRTIEALSA
jgi:alpha-methylacyl-CoA racemase